MYKPKLNLPPDVEFILYRLYYYGYEGYVVGGCVRDTILGREIHDWDITTSATPDEVIKLFTTFPVERIIPTGLQHGTVTLLIHGICYEVTTYRVDGAYLDYRRPNNVQFTNNIKEDLKRRDFTMNAIAYNPWDGIIDPFNGIGDIQDNIIRCVGSPHERFSEDALRILRAIRFAAQLDMTIANETRKAIFSLYNTLAHIATERINSEFCKIMLSNNAHKIINEYRNVFALFIPEIKAMFEFEQHNPWHVYDVWKHTIMALKYCDKAEQADLIQVDLITKLAIFFHDIGKPLCYAQDENGIGHFKKHALVGAEITDVIMHRLRFDNDTREKVVELIKFHDATFSVGKKYIKRWLNKLGEEQFRRLLVLKKADNTAQNRLLSSFELLELAQIEAILNDVLMREECFSMKDLAINGDDLIKIGFKQGKHLGEFLKWALNAVINGEIQNEKSLLCSKAEEWL